jgi:hypothetical protein
MKSLSSVFLSLLVASCASARHQLTVPPPLVDGILPSQRRSGGSGTFRQLVDHANPGLGTFSQRVWWSDEFYAGPGSPVIFFTPGEIEASGYTGYLTNRTLTGQIAKAVGGAIVMMEHRYWGASTPFDELNIKNLQYLTLNNSILDTTYFANNFRFPFDPNGTSTASKAPWIFVGGSYSGALSAWVHAKVPGTFWAHHATSAVVEAVGDFWRYFSPVQHGMPKNCSTDVSKVIEHADDILKTGTPEAKRALKDKFGLGSIVHDDDFAAALENGPWLWQLHDFTHDSGFFEFCDYVEVSVETVKLHECLGV